MKRDILNGWSTRWMPYGFQKITLTASAAMKAAHVWMPFGREYRPLGMPQGASDYVVYKDHMADRAVIFVSDPLKFKGIWSSGTERPLRGILWLYGGPAYKDDTYGARLGLLLTKIKGAYPENCASV